MLTAYDRWVRGQRPAKVEKPLDRPITTWVEDECLYDRPARPAPVGTIIINNRECPFSCLMCGYWRDTTDETPAPGLVAAQVAGALDAMSPGRPIRSVKLYNGGNFFDEAAVPPEDVDAIAERVRTIDLVVVECHPAIVGPAIPRFARRLDGRLEVAMGLEVAHPQILSLLNKKMPLGLFRKAAAYLREHDVLVKAFILVKPPFAGEAEAIRLGRETVDFAVDAGCDTVALIPTVRTPGAMDRLAADGFFAEPHLRTLHEVVAHALGREGLRVLVDLWEFDRLAAAGGACPDCAPALKAALREVNLRQRLGAAPCEACETTWRRRREEDRVRSWREFRGAYDDLPWRVAGAHLRKSGREVTK